MTFRFVLSLASVALVGAAPLSAQTPPLSAPMSATVVGGLSAGQHDAGGLVGGAFAFSVTDRIALEARGLHLDRGGGESGLDLGGAMLITVARAPHVAPYVAVGGGIYRASFDLGDSRFFGMMSGQYAAGTTFAPTQNAGAYPMMGHTMYAGSVWQGPWSGSTFTTAMPMFYANRLGQMMVPANGMWGTRSFTDPALTFGGGVDIDLTRRLYLRPDLRGLVVFGDGDHLTMATMNVAFGVRF